ncbi:alpha/beta-hydrolase [Suillus brevipes Sb2]|nr:alpha/beta-hydrolase [Suillus brevipes Sb2]
MTPHYSPYGKSTAGEVAKDIAAFIAIFFENFTQFEGRALHMASESYGGRYIPVFAVEIYDQNAMLTAAGITPINLQSIMIGNGQTDFYTMLAACAEHLVRESRYFYVLIDVNIYIRSTQNNFRAHIYALSGKNPYDIGKDCDGPIEETMCYPVTKYISSFLNRPFVREKLGVYPSITGNFSFCSDAVRRAFVSIIDEYHATDTHVAALLERGVRALIFVGPYDWFCNWIGVQAWTPKMDWGGKEAFGQQSLRSWLESLERPGMRIK